MNEQQNNGREPEKVRSEDETDQAGSIEEVELERREPEGEQPEAKPGFLHSLRRSFERGWQRRPRAKKQNRQELRKDKTRTLVALAGFTFVMILMFVFVFSSPPRPKEINNSPPGTPDLGRRVTPGQGGPHENVTPLMNVNPGNNEAENSGQTTAQEVARTARPISGNSVAAGNETSISGSRGRKLADVDFGDQALQQQYAMHGTNPPQATAPAQLEAGAEADDLKAPSLVFVAAQNESATARPVQPAVETNSVTELLPVGTHLVARLEAPVSTALEAPAVAVIEYNYEQDGQIILPAGTKVIGKLRGATPQGYVSIEFNRLEFQNGATQKIEASAMGLDYKPLKGRVTGRNRGLRFLVQSLTGVGEIGAYMVGGNPGSTSVFSEDALLREQLAANMGMAGQEQFNELAMTQHIVVTVPGNTRFYLVLEQGTTAEITPASAGRVSNASGLPSTQELMELLELKRELAAATAQQGGSEPGQPVSASAQ